MVESLGISEVKAKLSAICDRAARGEAVRFARRRGNQVERFELRRIHECKRELGAWRGKLRQEEIDRLSAPLDEHGLAAWNI